MKPPEVMAWSGERLGPIPSDWWCETHARALSFWENKSKACVLCNPRAVRGWPTYDASGKPIAAAQARQKIIESIDEGSYVR
jgi:hypothetical protein